MNYYVALLHMKDQDLNVEFRKDHLDYLDRLGAEGKVFKKGPFEDGSGGMVIYVADSFEQAKSLAEADPYVSKGARSLDLRQWNAVVDPQ